MARLFADENFPLPVVDELRQLGHDVLTIQEAGLANQRFPDDAVLDFAKETGRSTVRYKHMTSLVNWKSFSSPYAILAKFKQWGILGPFA